ncbi:MAG TPA: FAD binding domain-containing protein, partial [Ktedonobacteraceae bacterium]|nr:FAD binding domain-containing protein [Ktedonobacteraceae bacterium]
MKPPRFRYFAPKSVGEALTLLEEHAAEARVLAGGQSLVPLMNMRLVHPDVLIDINGISELSFIEATNGGLAIGALTRDAKLAGDKKVAESLSVLSEAAHFVGHPAIRNRSTVGGSIAHADPAAELPAVIVALNGEMVVRNRSGSRTIAAQDFFKGFLTTDLKDGELLTEVRIPSLPPMSGSAFVEFARREGD